MSRLEGSTGNEPSRDFWIRMSDALLFPLREGGAVQVAIATVGIVSSGSCACCWSFGGMNMRVFSLFMYAAAAAVFGYTLSYLAHVCNDVTYGGRVLPAWPEYEGFVASGLKPTFTMLGSVLASSVLGIIALVVGILKGSDPIMFASAPLFGMGAFFYPIIFLHASRFDSFEGLRFETFEAIGEHPLEYGVVAMCAAIVPMPTILSFLVIWHWGGGWGMLTVLLGLAASVYASAIFAYAAGLFYYCHPDSFPE